MLKRTLILVHRWLGVALCLIFLLWFPSGIAMMYWDFPSVTEADRLRRSPALVPSTIHLSPAEAYARLGDDQPPGQARLTTFDRRPVYLFSGGGGEAMVYADSGERQVEVSDAMLARIASAWTGQPAGAATIEPVGRVDQWTIQGEFQNFSPLRKYSWPDGEQLYLSENTGAVVQYTTTASRLGAYVGAIPHWLYFLPLRQHGLEWSRLVVWSSGLGTVSALAGLVIAVWMYSPSRRYRYAGAPTGIPYRGQKRWHTILGLLFGAGAVTWAFSGMLSMDPFPIRGGPAWISRSAGLQACLSRSG
ncbi:MAG: PepSY domain-containing protein [Acidobacteriota bacterium]